MIFNYQFSLEKNFSLNVLLNLMLIFNLKFYFCVVNAQGDLRLASISEKEKIRRRKLVESYSDDLRNTQKNWLETYHESFSGNFALLEDKADPSSVSPDMCSADYTMPDLISMDTTINENSKNKNFDGMRDSTMPHLESIGKTSHRNSKNKNFDGMQDSLSFESHSKKYKSRLSEPKNSKENQLFISEENSRRLNVVNSFKPVLPSLDVLGEYIPKSKRS